VTFPILQAFRKKFPALHLLHVDAHPDLYHDFDGNPFSHASPFARVMENGLADRLVQIGIRTLNAHQKDQAQRFGVEMIEMKNWRDDLQFEFSAPLYVSIDLDGFDPAFAPGVSHPEPGGLTTRQALRVLQSLEGNIIGADIVELNPDRDPPGITAMLAAKLIKELCGKMLG
jgi:agmatinase